MVLAYWGLEQDQRRLGKRLQTIDDAGTPASRVRLLASRRLAVSYESGEWENLIEALVQGIPPILFVNTRELSYWQEATAHALVLLGIEDNMAIVNDPDKKPPAIRVLVDELHLAWDDMANLYALIRKK